MTLCVFAFTSQTFALESQKVAIILKRQAKQIKELNNKVGLLEQQINELKQQVNSNGHNDVSNAETHHQDENSNSDAINNQLSVDDAKKKYDIALAALKDRNYTIAEQDFKNFLTLYPKHQLTGRAMFWLGESQFRREIYDNSAVNFLKSYKTEPTGLKASDALLKLSISLSHLHKKQEACSMLHKLNKEFPNRSGESIKKAADLKSKLECK